MGTDAGSAGAPSAAAPLVAFVDNATLINACTLLSRRGNFDVYKLLDLETFCEAFLFYDKVQTLVGYSFASAFCHPSGTDESSELTTSSVYRQFIGRGILEPAKRGAGSVHYDVEGLEKLDEISWQIDLESVLESVTQVFGDAIPWSYAVDDRFRRRWDAKEQRSVLVPDQVAATEAAASVITIGEDTWVSDSYPIYYFSAPPEKRKERGPGDDDFGWELSKNRLTDWRSTFVSQTFYYVVEAAVARRPLLVSSVRTPIVQDLLGRLNGQFFSVVGAALGAVSDSARKKIAKVLEFFGRGSIQFVSIPALACVLAEARSADDVIPALLRMRERTEVREFRKWCRALQQSWEEEDVDAVLHSIEEVRGVTEDLARSTGLDRSTMDLAHLGDVRLLTTTGRILASATEDSLIKACYSPGLVFLRNIGGYLESAGRHLKRVEQILGHSVTAQDRETLAALATRREHLYSPGRITAALPEVRVDRIKVEVKGDVFSNISQSVIATRGSTARAVWNLREGGRDELAHAIDALTKLLAESHQLTEQQKTDSTNLLAALAEESATPEPRPSVLRSVGQTLVETVKAVPLLADAVTKVLDLMRALPG